MKTKVYLCLLLMNSVGIAQQVADDQAQIFAPGSISKQGRMECAIGFMPDGNECYITVRNKAWTQSQIFCSHKRNGEWTELTLTSFSDNQSIGAWPTPDGHRIYFTSSRPKYPPSNIWMCTRTKDGWSAPVKVDTPLNSEKSEWSCHPTASGTQYFCSWRDGGVGHCDIWWLRNGQAEPLNQLNTENGDCGPVTDPNERILVFNSTRPGGHGTADLYISFRKTDGSWGSPQNMGPLVNTQHDEGSPAFSPDGQTLYFARTQGDESDIYSIKLKAVLASLPETPCYLRFAWAVADGLVTPETALYDAEHDVIYVSNFNVQGGFLAPGDNSHDEFISRISPEGQMLELKWVKGLNSPTGMSISGNTLYVVERRGLAKVDINTGRIIGRVPLPDSHFTNDVVAAPDGAVYVTDNNAQANTTIYKITGHKVESWMARSEIYRCNGITIDGPNIIAFNGHTMSLVAIDRKTKAMQTIAEMNFGKLTGGTADGIVKVDDQTYLVTDWAGPGYLVSKTGKVTPIIHSDHLPLKRGLRINNADVGYIPGRKLYLIPTFSDHRVLAYRLSKY